MNPAESNPISRREFTRRAAWAGASVATASIIGTALHRTHPPDPRPARKPFEFGDYLRPGTAGRIGIVTGGDRATAVARAIEALGGMAAFVHPGERVLIKVNAAFSSPPIVGATTHPEALEAVIRLCRAAGAADVFVTDNPINDPATCFRLTGIAAAASHAGARLVMPESTLFQPYTQAGSRLLRDWPVLAAPFERIERVIGMTPVKDHHRSGASMTLKNWYGLLGGRRNVFHQNIHGIIGDLAMLFRPTLVILDGTQTMISNGPTGGSTADLKPTRTVIASTDPVAADCIGAGLLDRGPDNLPFLLKAAQRGAGTLDVEALKPRRVALA